MVTKLKILYTLRLFREVPDTITLTINPKVEFLSSANSPVMVSARVNFDNKRLRLASGPTEEERVSPNTKLTFKFNPAETNFGIDQANPNPDGPKMARLRYDLRKLMIFKIVKMSTKFRSLPGLHTSL